MAAPAAPSTKNSSPAASPSSEPSAPKAPRLPRYVKRANHARLAGNATLEAHGVAHYRRMSLLSAAARQANPQPSQAMRRYTYTMADGQVETIRAIAYHAGVSQSAIVREALAQYFARLASGEASLPEPEPRAAGAKAPKRKRPAAKP